MREESDSKEISFGLCILTHRIVVPLRTAISASLWLLISLFVVYTYVHDLEKIPNGFFCDEVEIGLESEKLVSQYLPAYRVPLFYDHFSYYFGALPLYSTAPFVFVLGLSEISVRLSSSLFMLASFLVLYWGLKKRLGARSARLVVLFFALTPTCIHIARVNLGHSPSIFFMLLGFTLFSTAREKNDLFLSALSGLCFGASAYGYSGYLVATPLFIFCLCVTELLFNRRSLKRCKPVLVLLAVAVICYMPIVYTAVHNPEFWTRWNFKLQDDTSTVDTVLRIIQNYPKYYGIEYLFLSGEVGSADATITRNTVSGAGILLAVTLPLLAAGLLSFLRKTSTEDRRYFFPFLILLFLYPVPDVLTTRSGYPPYTFSVFTTLLFVPYLVAAGLATIHDFVTSHVCKSDRVQKIYRILFTPLLMATILSQGIYFSLVTYRQYPLTASDIWGWQSGAREMIDYFLVHANEYDEFYMEYAFNEPEVFFDFYIKDQWLRQKAYIGGLEKLDPGKKQLFGVSRNVFDRISTERTLEVKSVIKYPDGSDAFYLVINDLERLKKAYLPIESAEEALRYALAATPYRAYYDDYPTSFPHADAKVRYFTDRIEATRVDTIDRGYIVHLFDFEEMGCNPWSFYSVLVNIDQNGTIAVSRKTALYQFDIDDPRTKRICIVEALAPSRGH